MSLGITTLACISALFLPEIRSLLGLREAGTFPAGTVWVVYAMWSAACISLVFWIWRAKRKSLIDPSNRLPRFTRKARLILTAVPLIFLLFATVFVFVLHNHSNQPDRIPVVQIRLDNRSGEGLRLSPRAEFYLFIDEPLAPAVPFDSGYLNIYNLDSEATDLYVSKEGEIALVGEIDNLDLYKDYFDIGNIVMTIALRTSERDFIWSAPIPMSYDDFERYYVPITFPDDSD